MLALRRSWAEAFEGRATNGAWAAAHQGKHSRFAASALVSFYSPLCLAKEEEEEADGSRIPQLSPPGFVTKPSTSPSWQNGRHCQGKGACSLALVRIAVVLPPPAQPGARCTCSTRLWANQTPLAAAVASARPSLPVLCRRRSRELRASTRVWPSS